MKKMENFEIHFGSDEESRRNVTILRDTVGWFLLSMGDSGLVKYSNIGGEQITYDKDGKLIVVGVDEI